MGPSIFHKGEIEIEIGIETETVSDLGMVMEVDAVQFRERNGTTMAAQFGPICNRVRHPLRGSPFSARKRRQNRTRFVTLIHGRRGSKISGKLERCKAHRTSASIGLPLAHSDMSPYRKVAELQWIQRPKDSSAAYADNYGGRDPDCGSRIPEGAGRLST
ncbi:hypothetical protein AXG93_4620s1970 [Marchantia polymorpha subsp. ruderalis]|uniref:Uncharacterized protein n=1 Tax=Marchantia polymorpha subsp. ruderalis TaxID=1480154 RepID=A0A176VYN7_MARPO|nr:hypothetical protein AXG93_4620s1970 [Marchantia polymorpha subsp. ruderalis]